MTSDSRRCFVVMPFRPDLNFLYLYLQRYLQEKHGLHVERGDHRIESKALLETVRRQILDADVIIGDITGGNPNVFYELGLADAYDKPVVLMTQDAPEKAPADVRHRVFIVYNLVQHEELLSKLDNAIHNVFVASYRPLYDHAVELLKEFNAATGSTFERVTAEEFVQLVMQGERTQGIPDEANSYLVGAFLLPRILRNPVADPAVMRKVSQWLDTRYGSLPHS